MMAHLEEVICLLPELRDLEWFVPCVMPLMRLGIGMAGGTESIAIFRVEASVFVAPEPIVRVVEVGGALLESASASLAYPSGPCPYEF